MAGRPVPATAIPPELEDNDGRYVNAFWHLSTCRIVGPSGVPGPIPWTAIDQYAERYGFVYFDDIYDEFVAVISAMDQEFVTHMNKQAELNISKRENKFS